MNFRDAMNTKLEDIPVPPLAPVGIYRFRISKQPSIDSFSDGKYDAITFPVQAQEAVTVDADELAEFGAVTSINLQVRFMFNTDPAEEANNARAMDRLRNFLTKHLGLKAGLSVNEAIAEALGAEFLGEIGHRPDRQDPEKVYAEIRKTMPLGD